MFLCKTHFIDSLGQGLGLNISEGNPTYSGTLLSEEDIVRNHKTVLHFFRVFTALEFLDLPELYWIPEVHKDKHKQRYIAGSTKISAQSVSDSYDS